MSVFYSDEDSSSWSCYTLCSLSVGKGSDFLGFPSRTNVLKRWVELAVRVSSLEHMTYIPTFLARLARTEMNYSVWVLVQQNSGEQKVGSSLEHGSWTHHWQGEAPMAGIFIAGLPSGQKLHSASLDQLRTFCKKSLWCQHQVFHLN